MLYKIERKNKTKAKIKQVLTGKGILSIGDTKNLLLFWTQGQLVSTPLELDMPCEQLYPMKGMSGLVLVLAREFDCWLDNCLTTPYLPAMLILNK